MTMDHEMKPLEAVQSNLPKYERPEIQVMNETELLSAIQINAAGTSWWVM
jgi:hypothetical protein